MKGHYWLLHLLCVVVPPIVFVAVVVAVLWKLELLPESLTPCAVSQINTVSAGKGDNSRPSMLAEVDMTRTALAASWAKVRSALRRDVEGSDSEESSPRERLIRFAGFVEGRMVIEVPCWWVNELLSVRMHPAELGGNLYLFARDHEYYGDDSPYERSASGLLVSRGLLITRELGAGIVVEAGNDLCRISDGVMIEAGSNGPIDCVTGLFEDGTFYYALHSNRTDSYELAAQVCGDDSQKWVSRVSALGAAPVRQGIGHHYVELIAHDDILYVFGTGNDCMYIESFMKADGSRLWGFCTNARDGGGVSSAK